jgi:hypothetical protein
MCNAYVFRGSTILVLKREKLLKFQDYSHVFGVWVKARIEVLLHICIQIMRFLDRCENGCTLHTGGPRRLFKHVFQNGDAHDVSCIKRMRKEKNAQEFRHVVLGT